MSAHLDDFALNQLFRTARTRNAWSERPVPDSLLRELYETLCMAPTSANSNPGRFTFVRSKEAKQRLAECVFDNNRPKMLKAPVTVIVAHDLDFTGKLPALFPARGEALKVLYKQPQLAQATAFRNGTLQGGYLILAARALGLDCGPMSGFDNAAVDEAFFAGTNVKSNFLCSLGYGTDEGLFPRNPRLSFEEACQLM